MAIAVHYFRAGRPASSLQTHLSIVAARRGALAVAGLLAALPVWAQYPGQVTKKTNEAPELRAVAVLEWTGELGKPKACRIVPVAVLDGGQLQDGGIYLARPEPLALAGEVEYQLERNGKSIGLFDIKNAGQEQGSWVGYGAWKPMPKPVSRPSKEELAQVRIDDEDGDRPILHRKKHPKEADGGASAGSGSGSSTPAAPSDPDRPTLHKKTTSDSSSADTGSSSAPDPDRPTLHKKSSDDGNSAASSDPDRPTIKKSKKPPEDVGHVSSLPDVTDPDRPRLRRGRSNADNLAVVPSLMGLPPDMQQVVAVSDARSRPDHPWEYAWSNPDDEAKMKAALEDIARDALGLTPPPAAPAPKRTATAKTARKSLKLQQPPLPAPAPLIDEQFRVFELAYGSGATLVLTARTDGPLAQQKFVTLVAQPDLYGNVLVLLKNVADGAHLDETPRMRLVDAVDAMADNRGELLFELRSETARQFALYRVLRGTAEKLFVSGGGDLGAISRE